MKKRFIYRPRCLVDGESIGRQGLYVAIPEKYKNHTVVVQRFSLSLEKVDTYIMEEMIIGDWSKAEAFYQTHDKNLAYFPWRPGEEI